MFSLKTLAASYTLSAKLDPDKIASILNHMEIKRSTALDYVYPNNVKMAAVQMQLEPFRDFKAFVAECRRLIEAAIQNGAHLILFPHLTGLLPITADKTACGVFCRFIDELLSEGHNDFALQQHFLKLMERFSDFLFDCYYNLFLVLAHKYNIYIAAGSTYILTAQGVFCRSYLFSPDHADAFFQEKIHLSPLEKRLGILPGNQINILDLKIGKTAILCDCDAAFYECFKVSKALGAQIILVPSMKSEVYSHTLEYNAALMQAQHFGVYTARSCFFSTGSFLNAFEGSSGIYAPLALTKNLDGILAYTKNCGEKSQVVCARIEPPKLSENMDVYSFSSSSSFCKPMIENVYPSFFKHGFPAPSSAFSSQEPPAKPSADDAAPKENSKD